MVARTYAKESLYLVGVLLDLDTHTLSNDIQVYTDLAIRFGLSYSKYLHASSLLEFRPLNEVL